jgi:hypothetical protein
MPLTYAIDQGSLRTECPIEVQFSNHPNRMRKFLAVMFVRTFVWQRSCTFPTKRSIDPRNSFSKFWQAGLWEI